MVDSLLIAGGANDPNLRHLLKVATDGGSPVIPLRSLGIKCQFFLSSFPNSNTATARCSSFSEASRSSAAADISRATLVASSIIIV